jgi:hypothetical protein
MGVGVNREEKTSSAFELLKLCQDDVGVEAYRTG